MLWATEDQWEASMCRRRRRLSSRSEMREESGAGVRTRALWWRRKVAADSGCRVLVCVVSPAWPLGQRLPRTHCPAGRDKQTSDKLLARRKQYSVIYHHSIPVQHWAELDYSDREPGVDDLRPPVTHQDEDEGGARPDGDDDRQPQTHRGRPRANEERWENPTLYDYL